MSFIHVGIVGIIECMEASLRDPPGESPQIGTEKKRKMILSSYKLLVTVAPQGKLV